MGTPEAIAMTELLTSAQMRAIEGAAIASGAVTGLALMERAGQGVVEAVFETWPALAPEGWGGRGAARGGGPAGAHRAVVLCGPGNNGGDGFVVARLLAGLGWAVEVFLYGEADRLPPDARANDNIAGAAPSTALPDASNPCAGSPATGAPTVTRVDTDAPPDCGM